MKQNLLLIKDVDDLGKSGEVVSVNPGFSRNFLLPQKKAIVADKHTLLMQKRLKAEREKQAIGDKKDAEELAKTIEKLTLSIDVKVDPEGRMYGSVSASDIVELLKNEGVTLDKKNILIKKPIKETGVETIHLKLKENVPASFVLKIIPEGGEEPLAVIEEEVKEEVEEQIEEQEKIDNEEE